MQGRRGTLYHVEDNSTPGTTADRQVRKKFASGRFFFSSAGILNLVAIAILLVAAVIFLATSTSCHNPPTWYPWLFPLMTLLPALITAAIFALFVLGVAEENPDVWIKVALGIALIEVVAIVAVSVLTISGCDVSSSANNVPAPLGLAGAVLLAIASAALFIMWKYRKEESGEVAQAPAATQESAPRKSIFI